MSLIIWSPFFETGIAELDEQHRHMVGLINTLHRAVLSGQHPSVLSEALAELSSYAHRHFAHEERLMADYHYLEASQHKRRHQDASDALVSLRHSFEQARPSAADDTLRFLRDWFGQHMLNADKRMASALRRSMSLPPETE